MERPITNVIFEDFSVKYCKNLSPKVIFMSVDKKIQRSMHIIGDNLPFSSK